jgi:hypothetical protein
MNKLGLNIIDRSETEKLFIFTDYKSGVVCNIIAEVCSHKEEHFFNDLRLSLIRFSSFCADVSKDIREGKINYI